MSRIRKMVFPLPSRVPTFWLLQRPLSSNLHYESPSNICKQQQHKKVGSLFYCEPKRVTQNWIKELLIDYIVHGNGSPCQYHEPHDLNNSQGCELILQWEHLRNTVDPRLSSHTGTRLWLASSPDLIRCMYLRWDWFRVWDRDQTMARQLSEMAGYVNHHAK